MSEKPNQRQKKKKIISFSNLPPIPFSENVKSHLIALAISMALPFLYYHPDKDIKIEKSITTSHITQSPKITTRKIPGAKPEQYTFALDFSPSMEGDGITAINHSLDKLNSNPTSPINTVIPFSSGFYPINNLGKTDLKIVKNDLYKGFTPGDFQDGTLSSELQKKIDYGGTEVEKVVDFIVKDRQKNPENYKNSAIILMSDGSFGFDEKHFKLVKSLGLPFFTIGIGDAYMDRIGGVPSQLKRIAKDTNGAYSTGELQDLPELLLNYLKNHTQTNKIIENKKNVTVHNETADIKIIFPRNALIGKIPQWSERWFYAFISYLILSIIMPNLGEFMRKKGVSPETVGNVSTFLVAITLAGGITLFLKVPFVHPITTIQVESVKISDTAMDTIVRDHDFTQDGFSDDEAEQITSQTKQF